MGYYYGWLIPSANFFDLVKNTTEMLKKKKSPSQNQRSKKKKKEFKFPLSIKPSAILFALSSKRTSVPAISQMNLNYTWQ